MIGCVAKAQSYEVLLNTSEMEDVQWYDRAELAAAVKWYDSSIPLQEAQKRSWANLGFFVPPPFAIAHHLMRAWALREVRHMGTRAALLFFALPALTGCDRKWRSE